MMDMMEMARTVMDQLEERSLLVKQHQTDPLILLARTSFVIRQMEIEGSLLLLFSVQLDMGPCS